MATTDLAKIRSGSHSDAGNFFDGVPALPQDLVETLRNKMDLDEPDRARADAAIAASCRAMKDKFAAASGGRWEDDSDER